MDKQTQTAGIVGERWPAGSQAWFVCRARGLVGDVMLPIRTGAVATEDRLAKQGRMRAARQFKRTHSLHPCTKVECEFQGVEIPQSAA